MPKTNVEIVQELLAGATQPEVVDRLVSPDAVYISLTYDNPDLKKMMPYAGVHQDGKEWILKTFQIVHTIWHIEDFKIDTAFGDDGENVAIFGSFTTHSVVTDKKFNSPLAVLAKVRDGQVVFMQYMEDTFGTGATFHVGGVSKFHSAPEGDEVEVGPTAA